MRKLAGSSRAAKVAGTVPGGLLPSTAMPSTTTSRNASHSANPGGTFSRRPRSELRTRMAAIGTAAIGKINVFSPRAHHSG
jgi:hypothetical protein